MKIMQRELLITNGLLENGQIPPDPLPCVPLKLLAHNELIGRVIGMHITFIICIYALFLFLINC